MATDTEKNAALSELLAAEAFYLRTRDWVPFSANGTITWRDPSTSVHYIQTMAVSMQRAREEQAEQKKDGGDDRT